MRSEIFLAVLFAGLAIGVLIGCVTRPAILGVPLPLSVLFSAAEADVPFKAALQSHLAMWAGIGGIASAALMGLATYFARRA